jgi:Tol biopolymer transport system component
MSVAADGLPLWVVEVSSRRASMIAETVLVNLRYQSWAPDSSRLVFTAGGGRSAQEHKWLSIYDTTTGRTRTVIKEDRQVPGIVNWSPNGDWIAYAAISSHPETDNGWMTFANPAISSRRICLFNSKTGQHQRLNRVESYQDAPCWGERRDELFYVELHDNRIALMVTNLTTGITATVTEVGAPEDVGYYGQADWDDLLRRRNSAR